MKLFAGNLSPSLDEETLKQAAMAWAEVLSVSIARDEQGQSRGFGFIETHTAEAAQALLSGLNGVELEGQPLKLSEARPEKRLSQSARQARAQQHFAGGQSSQAGRSGGAKSKGGFNIGTSGRNKV